MKIYDLCNEEDYNYVNNSIEKIKQSLAGVLIGGYPAPTPYIREYIFYKERYKYYYSNDKGKLHCLTGAAVELINSKQRFYAIDGLMIGKKDFFKKPEVIEAIKTSKYLEEHPELKGFL